MNIVNRDTGKKVFVAGHDIDACLTLAWIDHPEFMEEAKENDHSIGYERTVKRGIQAKKSLMMVIGCLMLFGSSVKAEDLDGADRYSLPVVNSYEGVKVVQKLHPTFTVVADKAHLPSLVRADDFISLEFKSYWCEPTSDADAECAELED